MKGGSNSSIDSIDVWMKVLASNVLRVWIESTILGTPLHLDWPMSIWFTAGALPICICNLCLRCVWCRLAFSNSNASECVFLFISRFVFSDVYLPTCILSICIFRLAHSGLYFPICIFRWIFSYWYFSDLYFPNLFVRWFSSDLYFRIVVFDLYFPICIFNLCFRCVSCRRVFSDLNVPKCTFLFVFLYL